MIFINFDLLRNPHRPTENDLLIKIFVTNWRVICDSVC